MDRRQKYGSGLKTKESTKLCDVKFVVTNKVIKTKRLNLQLDEKVIKALDDLAKSKKLPRQRLINAILESALNNPDFTVFINGY